MVNWLHCQLGKETFTPEDWRKRLICDISVPKYRFLAFLFTKFECYPNLFRYPRSPESSRLKPGVTDWLTHITSWASCDSKKIPMQIAMQCDQIIGTKCIWKSFTWTRNGRVSHTWSPLTFKPLDTRDVLN